MCLNQSRTKQKHNKCNTISEIKTENLSLNLQVIYIKTKSIHSVLIKYEL